MKPTPEQIAAVKAWTKCDESSRQHALLLGSHTHDSMGRIAAEILLAALESAEERANIANRVLAAYSKVLDVLGAPAEGSDLQDLHEWAGALKTKLEAAEQDTARLDWLQLYLSDFTKNVSGPTSGGPGWEFGYNAGLGYMVDGCGDTLRDAIDAARKEDRT